MNLKIFFLCVCVYLSTGDRIFSSENRKGKFQSSFSTCEYYSMVGRIVVSKEAKKFVPKEAKAFICAHVRLCEKENDFLLYVECVLLIIWL